MKTFHLEILKSGWLTNRICSYLESPFSVATPLLKWTMERRARSAVFCRKRPSAWSALMATEEPSPRVWLWHTRENAQELELGTTLKANTNSCPRFPSPIWNTQQSWCFAHAFLHLLQSYSLYLVLYRLPNFLSSDHGFGFRNITL